METRSKILTMYYDEHLTIGEIASALKLEPKYVIRVIKESKEYSDDEAP